MFSECPRFYTKLDMVDRAGGTPQQPEQITRIEQLGEREALVTLSIQTFAEFFSNEDSLGLQVFPSGHLFGRKRTASAVEQAMKKPITAIEGLATSTRFLNSISPKRITTVKDFFDWQISQKQFAKLENDRPDILEKVPEAFAQELLPTPEARLLKAVFAMPYETTPPIISRENLHLEDTMREVIEKEVLSLRSPKYAIVLILRYGLYSGVPETVQQVAKKVPGGKAGIQDAETKAIKILRHPQHQNKFLQFLEK